MFGSLTPVWTRLGIHGMDASDPAAPEQYTASCQARPSRDTQTWDTLGHARHRQRRHDPRRRLRPDKYIARMLPAGAVDAFLGALFALRLTGIASIYYGIAQRARDLAVEATKKRTSLAVTRSMAYHPEMQHWRPR